MPRGFRRCLLHKVCIQVGCDAQLGVTEQHADLHELHAGGDQAHPAIKHLNDLEASLKQGQIDTWRQEGVSEAEIARETPKVVAHLTAVFDAWRAEVQARLGI